MSTQMIIEILFVISPKWKQSKFSSVWKYEETLVYRYGILFTLKGNEIFFHSKTSVNLKIIILMKETRPKNTMILFILNYRTCKLIFNDRTWISGFLGAIWGSGRVGRKGLPGGRRNRDDGYVHHFYYNGRCMSENLSSCLT